MVRPVLHDFVKAFLGFVVAFKRSRTACMVSLILRNNIFRLVLHFFFSKYDAERLFGIELVNTIKEAKDITLFIAERKADKLKLMKSRELHAQKVAEYMQSDRYEVLKKARFAVEVDQRKQQKLKEKLFKVADASA